MIHFFRGELAVISYERPTPVWMQVFLWHLTSIFRIREFELEHRGEKDLCLDGKKMTPNKPELHR